MQQSQLEEDIKSDIVTISTMKMQTVSAREFYWGMFGWPLKLSILLLALNTMIRLALIGLGLSELKITVELMLGTWLACLVFGFFLGMMFRHFYLISQLIKARLKTAALVKKTFNIFGGVFLGIYSVIYALLTFCAAGGGGQNEYLMLTIIFPQMFAFVPSMIFTAILFEMEIGRLGLGALFNVLSEWISKSKSTNPLSEEK